MLQHTNDQRGDHQQWTTDWHPKTALCRADSPLSSAISAMPTLTAASFHSLSLPRWWPWQLMSSTFFTGWNFPKSDVTCLKWLYFCEKTLFTLFKASNRGSGVYESPGEHWFQVWMNRSCSQFPTLSHLGWIAPHSRRVTRKHSEI